MTDYLQSKISFREFWSRNGLISWGSVFWGFGFVLNLD